LMQIDSQHSALSLSHDVGHSSSLWRGICRPSVGQKRRQSSDSSSCLNKVLLLYVQ
jgi:hypothetical protein